MGRKKKEKISVMVQLTDEEIIAYSRESAQAHIDKAATEDSLKSYSTQAKAEIATLDARINALSNKINMGKELRAIDCLINYDWEKKEKSWVRMDTGEIVKTDIVTEEEMQEEAKLES